LIHDPPIDDRYLFVTRRQNYIDSLLPVFETCEDLEDLDGLHVLHNIMKSISKFMELMLDSM
jgi:hypothetical protein